MYAVRSYYVEIGPEVILAALKTFQPGPHRIQPVGELHGVYFVNDSKATNTGAVISYNFV